MGCRLPGRTPGAGRVTSSHSRSSLAASCSCSNLCFFASYSLSRSCFTEFSSFPSEARCSGGSLPNSLLICASVPLRPSASTRASSKFSCENAEAKRASVVRRNSSNCASSIEKSYLLQAGAELLEHGRHVLVTFLQRQIERPLVIIRSHFQIGVMRQEHFDDFPIAVLRRSVQRRPATRLPGIRIGAFFKQQFRQVCFLPGRGSMERRVLHCIRGLRIHFGATLNQRLRQIFATKKGCQMQWSPAIGRMRPNQRRIAVQLAQHCIRSARCRRGEYVQCRAERQQIFGHLVASIILRKQQRALSRIV